MAMMMKMMTVMMKISENGHIYATADSLCLERTEEYLIAALNTSRFGLWQVDVINEHLQLLVFFGSIHKA